MAGAQAPPCQVSVTADTCSGRTTTSWSQRPRTPACPYRADGELRGSLAQPRGQRLNTGTRTSGSQTQGCSSCAETNMGRVLAPAPLGCGRPRWPLRAPSALSSGARGFSVKEKANLPGPRPGGESLSLPDRTVSKPAPARRGTWVSSVP